MLNKKQLTFLYEEFGITDIDYSNITELQDIRDKCFDVETDETLKHFDESDIGDRGNTAVSIIDDLYGEIKKTNADMTPEELKLFDTIMALPTDRDEDEVEDFAIIISLTARQENRIDEFQHIAETSENFEVVLNTIFSERRVEIVDEDWDVEE